MDSSTLVRRTPAGDAEVAHPANGLSLTQRRILTLLDTPGRLGELPVGPAFDAARLQREASRLAQAGLITFEAQASAATAVAANAATVGWLRQSFARPLPLAMLAIATVAIAWGGLHFTAAPAPGTGPRAKPPSKPAPANVAAPVPTPEPSVIATRVLRGEPRAPAVAAKPPPDAAPPSAPATNPESRTEHGPPARQE